MLWSSVNYFAIFCSILTFNWWGALSASKSEGKSSIFPQTKTKLLSGASSALKMTTLLCFCSVLFYYVLLQQRRNAQCCCFPACSPFLTSSIFVYLSWSSLKNSCSIWKRCYLMAIPKEMVSPFLSTFHCHKCKMWWGTAPATMRVKVPLTSSGSNLHPWGPIGKMGRNFHFHREFATLNCVETANIFFTGQSSSHFRWM